MYKTILKIINIIKMNVEIFKFYQEYLEKGSNISEQAARHGITNTECYMLVKMGERISKLLV